MAMTDLTTHDTFTIERTFNASPDRVFEALANPEQKARWFSGPASWKLLERKHDFRVGGTERVSGLFESGMSSTFDAHFLDIVPNRRLVYSYEMSVNGRKISVSLATWEFVAVGAKTKVVLTEQGAYFPDPDLAKYAPEGPAASRLNGTKALLDRFEAVFAK
jgi:uncharacterized protein YndB with AHSA1/START domain